MEYLVEMDGKRQPPTRDETHAKFYAFLRPKEELRRGDVVFFGIPFEGLIYTTASGRYGPKGIRDALEGFRTYSPELKIDIAEAIRFADLGDVNVEPLDYEETFKRTGHVLKEVLKQGWVPIIFGGSHSITEGTVRAFSEYYDGKIGVLWIDAHPDTMESYHGDKHYNGCPQLRLVEDGFVKGEKIAAMGLRGFFSSKATMDKMEELGIQVFDMNYIRKHGLEQTIEEAVKIVKDGTEAFYTTIDIDATEGAYVPGTQGPTVGGFTPAEMTLIARKASLLGSSAFDITEVAPPLDVAQMTTKLAATLVLEMISGVAYRSRR